MDVDHREMLKIADSFPFLCISLCRGGSCLYFSIALREGQLTFLENQVYMYCIWAAHWIRPGI